MHPDDQPIIDEQLEAFLDQIASDSAQEALRQRLAGDAESAGKVRAAMDLQQRIDQSLRRSVWIEPPSPESIQAMLAPVAADSVPADTARLQLPDRSPRQKLLIGLLAAAAIVAWLFVSWQFVPRRAIEPVFHPQPLAELYRETVKKGFEPYYECHEPERFAATFRQRQGKPLALAGLPDGTRMLGLSYSGGISRDTTAMLCEVDGHPVMVFVDTAANEQQIDRDLIAREDSIGGSLHVFRQQRDGLVFFEVTPYPQPRVTEFMITAD